ncbi:hypothetical protein ACIPPS_02175 [Streptomyces sp. NPDC090127]|uniref:hypothetical protein n=1 Tax=Streptomyces sp. NPDC090127 TaxID=3365953 RepID=UPI0038179534
MTALDTPTREAASGPPRTSVLRTELRRGTGPWSGAAVAVTTLVTLYAKAPGWQSRWTDATDMLHIVVGLLLGPLVLAVGCWQGGRDRRNGTRELLGSVPRGPLRRAFLAVAPTALWPVAGYLSAAAVCLLATWPYVDGGRRPFLELVAADAVTLAALGTLGHLVGRLVPWRLTAPLLAVTGYVVFGVAAARTEAAGSWLNPAVEHFYAWDRPVGWFAPAWVVWCAGLALAALLAQAAGTARLRLLALVPLTAAVAAAVPIARLPLDGPWRPDPAAARLVCDGGAPPVCLPAVDRALLPDISAALAPLNERLRGLPGAPTRWVGGPSVGAGETALPSPDLDAVRGELSHPDLYLNSAVQFLFAETCRSEDFSGPEVERLGAIHLAVSEWLAPTPAGYGVPVGPAGQRYLDALRAKSPAAQRDYLARYMAADGCRPEEVPVP